MLYSNLGWWQTPPALVCMLINCYTEIPVEPDEPIEAIRALVRVLRESTTDLDNARLELNLVATSKRGQSAIREFQPQRTQGVLLSEALAITEELMRLTPAKMSSLHLIATAEGFRWKGSEPGSTARLVLLDTRSLRRKQRFALGARLAIEAERADDRRVEAMVRRIRTETGLEFELESSHMQLTSTDPDRATPDEALLTALAWNEFIESVSEKTRSSVRLDDEPLVKNHWQASDVHRKQFGTGGPRHRVDFPRAAQRWVKAEFAQYSTALTNLRDGFYWRKIAPDVLTGFYIDKKAGPFGREFTISLAAGLTSRRFAAAPDRPLVLPVSLFRLFGIGGSPLRWTYATREDLAEAFASAARLMQPALALFEAEAARLGRAHEFTLAAFSGPRYLSALEAHGIAAATARDWAKDASLVRMGTFPIAQGLSPVEIPMPPALNGRLTPGGGWSLRYHSGEKQRNLDILLPCYGSPARTTMDAATGHQWPGEADQILDAGWMDSTEATRIALEAARGKWPELLAEHLKVLALASTAKALKTGLLPSPPRDGMFEMEAWWSATFARSGPDGKRSVLVRVPAHGGDPIVDAHEVRTVGIAGALCGP
jgi:hypothetical protein